MGDDLAHLTKLVIEQQQQLAVQQKTLTSIQRMLRLSMIWKLISILLVVVPIIIAALYVPKLVEKAMTELNFSNPTLTIPNNLLPNGSPTSLNLQQIRDLLERQ